MNPIFAAVFPVVEEILDRLIPDKAEAEKAKLEMQKALITSITEVDKAQAAINQEEAKSDNLFKSGWRPFIGWVCGSAFAYHFIIQPIIIFIAAIAGENIPTPEFNMETLLTVLMGMLGLGGLRTFEKFQGVHKR